MEYQETAHVASGVMTFTTKRLYFGGSEKSFHVACNKIVSISAMTTGSASSGTGSTPSPGISLKKPAKPGSP